MTYEIRVDEMPVLSCPSRQQALKAAEEMMGKWPFLEPEIVAVKGDGSEEAIFDPETQEIRKNGKTGKRGVRNKKKFSKI